MQIPYYSLNLLIADRMAQIIQSELQNSIEQQQTREPLDLHCFLNFSYGKQQFCPWGELQEAIREVHQSSLFVVSLPSRVFVSRCNHLAIS